MQLHGGIEIGAAIDEDPSFFGLALKQYLRTDDLSSASGIKISCKWRALCYIEGERKCLVGKQLRRSLSNKAKTLPFLI